MTALFIMIGIIAICVFGWIVIRNDDDDFYNSGW